MKIDCVKPYNGNYVIFIPTWKQNGGNMEPMLRSIHVENEGGTSQAGVANNMIQSFVDYHFKRICRQYNILDLDGKIYNLTSHQFRHNGITDRLETGFTMEQIADMTGHYGNAMIWNAYCHLNLKPETIVEKQRCVLKEPLCSGWNMRRCYRLQK